MPTDKDTAFGILVRTRKNEIGEEEWIKLIEARRNFIKPHLDRFTLLELGKTKCLRKNYSGFDRDLCTELAFDNPEIISDDGELSLKTQGIFNCQSWDNIKYDYPPSHRFPGGTMQIWGLARSGDWIIAKIAFTGKAGYKHRVLETAETAEIEKTDLATIISRTGEKPIDIWRTLGNAAEEWKKKSKILYKHALKIYETFEIEDRLLALITNLPTFD